ncbi:uncharacterized protein K460DRAFT_321489 [Cucurbitaria berberidis CBS 394.84]|uniref:TRP C-terminal domain-containing protein n=1 Tax=Cucurbitaria berberidis CBS 394.84 TaxID=1168544 RepID=A0A9P4L4H4_9PLEO|nr:uncharacterized protein K460DRAFT_321489 [Cucurbitaria berberidis CBS 394.84]KAF1840893.1 hypothetical protein K460DRAFT_321489 [Cucurbitaria berberidis CBS 394.84]
MAQLRPRTKLEWAFLGSTATQAIVITFIQVIVLISYLRWVNPPVYQVPLSYITPLSLVVTMLGCIFQVVLTLDALRIKNNIQVVAQCVCNLFISVAVVMQYYQIKGANDHILQGHDMYWNPFAKNDRHFWYHTAASLIVCIVTSCACSVVMCVLAYSLHREFAWALYQDVSSEQKMRNRYLAYQVYLVLMKFTVLFLTCFIIIYDFINVHYMEPEFSLTISIIPAALLHAVLAAYCVRVETAIGMALIMLIHMAEIVYLTSRLIVLCGSGFLSRTALKDQMLLFASVGLSFAIFTFITGAICISNFNKGLKPILRGQVQRKVPANQQADMYYFQRLNHQVPPVPDWALRRFDLD